MQSIANMPMSGVVVILAILALFAVALIALFSVAGRYGKLQRDLAGRRVTDDTGVMAALRQDYAAAYRQYGQNVNTPAIIDNVFAERYRRCLFWERFMNNAVSLFVTLGLFGTFLGLSLSVSSLTELLKTSGSEEWLSILNSVGGGLLSSLSGMGVAFYTSLVGVACSILFTILRTVFHPEALRTQAATMAELWLDNYVAPKLSTDFAGDDAARLTQLRDELHAHGEAVTTALAACTAQMERVLTGTTASLGEMIEKSKEPIGAFYETVSRFNDNVRDFSTINYDLRGNIERLDLCMRDMSRALRERTKQLSGSDNGGRA